ncbi:MAG: hypothetical protein K9G11_00055 [Rickettsiaceae bacterium]|nr:hypothetical protein [Rickettsiaceae bacterium]
MFVLDCHALQARNDATTLPLEDVVASVLEWLDCHALQARNDATTLPLGVVASFHYNCTLPFDVSKERDVHNSITFEAFKQS